MKKNRIALAALLLCTEAAAAAPAGKVVFQFDLEYGKGTFARQGTWLGLFCKGKVCELKDATVRIGDGMSADDTALGAEPLDVLKVHGKPLALFFRTTLQPGEVPTWFAMAVAAEYPRRNAVSAQLRSRGRWAMPWGQAPLMLSWVRLPDGQGYRYHLSDGVRKQFLLATSMDDEGYFDETPAIRWVGDLDRDGKADFLLSLRNHDCGYDQRLYLSSLAGKDAFVAQAAVVSNGRGSCGC